MTHSRAFLLLIYLLLTANYCLCKDRHNIRMALEPFQLNQIRLLPSPFKHAQTLDAEWLLSLEPDRLLHRFHKMQVYHRRRITMEVGKQKEEVAGAWDIICPHVP